MVGETTPQTRKRGVSRMDYVGTKAAYNHVVFSRNAAAPLVKVQCLRQDRGGACVVYNIVVDSRAVRRPKVVDPTAVSLKHTHTHTHTHARTHTRTGRRQYRGTTSVRHEIKKERC